jgi:predicted enzyme involved in methoxymalonyl-ACP biosynthesis
MEFAMMDELVHKAGAAGIKTIRGYYYPTAKNKMVRDFYGLMGFTLTNEDTDGNRTWEFEVSDDYKDQNHYIRVNGDE